MFSMGVIPETRIGFSVQLRDEDVVIWQVSADQGEQAVWLSRTEARELAKFVAGLDSACSVREVAA